MPEASSPILISEVPAQVSYAGVQFNSLNLNDFIQNQAESDGEIVFTATLADGSSLPNGLFCSADGLLSGRPSMQAISGEPYSVLVLAKNDADIPLVVYFDLSVLEAVADDIEIGYINFSDSDDDFTVSDESVQGEREVAAPKDDFEAFLSSLDVDGQIKAAAEYQGLNLSSSLNDEAFIEFFIRHWLRKFASMQIYNADVDFSALDITGKFDAKTGWCIYDSDVALTTTNPEPFSTDFSRIDFINTVREMIGTAAERGWKTVGVKGFDREVGWRLVNEYNEGHEHTLEFDDFITETTFMERAMRDAQPSISFRNQ